MFSARRIVCIFSAKTHFSSLLPSDFDHTQITRNCCTFSRMQSRMEEHVIVVSAAGKSTEPIDPRNPAKRNCTLDEAIEATVIGIGLVGIGGLIESVNMPVVAPYVNCVLDFSTAQQGMLLSASLFGMVCTLHFWGLVADSLGRQKALRASIIGGFSMSLLAVFSCDNCSQIVLRFLTGGFLAATQSVTLTYIAEFHSTAKAARAAAFVTIFHSSSWLVVSGLSIWIIPMDWVLWFASFPFRPWRLLLLILTLFNLWNSIVFSCLPESPKFSVANNREQEALEGLRMIYAFNTGKPKEVFGPTF